MPVTHRRPARVAGALFALILGLSAAHAVAQPETSPPAQAVIAFDIPAQSLEEALIEFGRQSRQELFYNGEDVSGKTSAGVSGSLPPLSAMAILLAGTGLEFEQTASGGLMIGDRATLDAQKVRLGASAAPLATAASVTAGTEAAEAGVATTGEQATARIDVSRSGGIEEIIITGQKREERIQDVPIAISAFSMDQLDAQKIEGGMDLLKAIPNVVFSKTNFSGYNFQIRGIGTQAISATTDPGVAVSMNNTTLIVNRLFEQEYLDMERVEVLRGPQGTLFGRNATAGVINVITAKPKIGVYEGELKLETGNYNAKRVRGHINLPISLPLMGEDTLAARLAYSSTQRDGYGKNLAADDTFVGREAPSSKDLDNRDLYTLRASIGWEPTPDFRANFVYEKFKEDDNRLRVAKQLCHTDPGTAEVAGFSLSDIVPGDGATRHPRSREFIMQTAMSQGCLPKSLFDKGNPADPNDNGAYGTPNGQRIPFTTATRLTAFNIGAGIPLSWLGCTTDANGIATNYYANSAGFINPCVSDPLAGGRQSHDLRTIYSPITPEYRAGSDYYELSFDYQIGDQMTLSSQSVYMDNEMFSTQDFLRFETAPNIFNNTQWACTNSQNPAAVCGPGTIQSNTNAFLNNNMPGGVFCDPQLGCSDRLMIQDVSQQVTKQFSSELRLVSNFDGPTNFSVGLNYTRFENTADYFVFSNFLTALATTGSIFTGGIGTGYAPGFPMVHITNLNSPYLANVHVHERAPGVYKLERVYVQREGLHQTVSNPEGHNFFMSRNPFELESSGLFGEMYYRPVQTVKMTAGLRFNWDRKVFTPTPSQTLLGDMTLIRQYSDGQGVDFRDSAAIRQFCVNSNVFERTTCSTSGSAPQGRGYPTLPDITQEWYVPTGRIGVDWQPQLDLSWWDETLLYAFYTRGYKAGGANPPLQAFPSGAMLEAAQGAVTRPTFDAEYVNALEIGTKNRLLGNALTLNFSAFYYDYKDYQVSKIIDRSAQNENFDAVIWGLELETLFAPTPDTLFNASLGYLRTRIGDGEQSIDLMDRTQGGNQHYVNPAWAALTDAEKDCNNPVFGRRHISCEIIGYRRDRVSGNLILDAEGNPIPIPGYPNGWDEWVVVRPALSQASNCVAPAALVREAIEHHVIGMGAGVIQADPFAYFCPAGSTAQGSIFPLTGHPQYEAAFPAYNPITDSPNGGAGFFADISGHELPNAPRFTLSLGAQHTHWFPGNDWSATGRIDWYWQDKSYHRVFNTEYDRLKDWTNTNVSLWLESQRHGLTIEVYVKNLLDETPVTGAFLNSDDTGLSTNVFTLDPRLVGLSVRKRF